MKAYRLEYPNGTKVIVVAKNVLDIIRRFDLATKENSKVKIVEI